MTFFQKLKKLKRIYFWKEKNIEPELEKCFNYKSYYKTYTDIYINSKIKIGIEYKIIKQMQLRTGFYTNPNQNTFGIGYTLHDLQFDIAIKKHQILGYSPLFSVSSAF